MTTVGGPATISLATASGPLQRRTRDRSTAATRGPIVALEANHRWARECCPNCLCMGASVESAGR